MSIPVELNISYSRKRQVKSYEPEEFWASIKIALETEDEITAVFNEQMAKLQGMIDNVVLAEEAEASLTERLGSAQYREERQEPWNEPEYSDLPFIEESTEAVGTAASGPSDGKWVITGPSKYEGKPNWWKLWHPHSCSTGQGGTMCYADRHNGNEGEVLQTNCKNTLNVPVTTPQGRTVEPGGYMNFTVPMMRVWEFLK